MSTNQYQEMRNRQQAEVNAFPMFFAFNKQQYATFWEAATAVKAMSQN